VEEQLLSAMREHPGASASELCNILGSSTGLVTSRWKRLARRGLIAKARDGHWRIAPPEAVASPPEPQRERERRFQPWVKPVGQYLRVETSEAAEGD
jgi:hypothetical protein